METKARCIHAGRQRHSSAASFAALCRHIPCSIISIPGRARCSPRSRASPTRARPSSMRSKPSPSGTRYCDDGRLEIDNFPVELALRGVAIGRRNDLFAAANSGGERAAAIYSLIATAMFNEIDPEALSAMCSRASPSTRSRRPTIGSARWNSVWLRVLQRGALAPR